MLTSEAKTLFIFPGQGSQYPGMGSDICKTYPQADKIYELASNIADYDLKILSFSDPDNRINLTQYTQPALLTHSIACFEAFMAHTGGKVVPTYAAGHSLGEYSALVASGCISFEDALCTVIRRGELMSEFGTGEMTAFSASLDEIQPLAEKHYCAIAGCNLPDQTVVGGSVNDLTRLEDEIRDLMPRKRFVRLKTEGAFHTYYMIKAAQKFRHKLNATSFGHSNCRTLSNYTGAWHEDDAESIKSKLFYQLFNPVLWHKNLITTAKAGVDCIIEFGGGIGKGETPAEMRPNLEGIIKKTFRHAQAKPDYLSVINCESIEASASALT